MHELQFTCGTLDALMWYAVLKHYKAHGRLALGLKWQITMPSKQTQLANVLPRLWACQVFGKCSTVGNNMIRIPDLCIGHEDIVTAVYWTGLSQVAIRAHAGKVILSPKNESHVIQQLDGIGKN